MMKFKITITFSKVISFMIAVVSMVLSWMLNDSIYWNVGIPASASLALGKDLATNFGKQCKE